MEAKIQRLRVEGFRVERPSSLIYESAEKIDSFLVDRIGGKIRIDKRVSF
jgi:hypothetical protein